jgi:hypothetical protein
MENNEMDNPLEAVVLDDENSLDGRISIAKKIGILGIVASILLSGVTLLAVVGNTSKSESSLDLLNSTLESLNSDYGLDELDSDITWVPVGFEAWPADTDVAFKYPGTPNCDDYNCVDIQFVSRYGCSYFYAAANYLDGPDGNVIGFDNATLPSLQPLQIAKFRFEDVTNSSFNWQISEINCR